VPGGGTIAFVDPVGHRYLDDPVAREEGGTPAIVESIRAGLVVALKQAVGADLIHAREQRFLHRALDRWRANPNLELLGDLEVPRLPIVSVRVRHGDRHLHHELVVAMLNDVFGIQARGGCSCAGPTVTGCSATTPSTPAPATGATTRHPPTRPRRCPACYSPDPGPAVGEDALPGYLTAAWAILTAAPSLRPAEPPWLPPELERLRDFSLPPVPAARPR
jgi:hypothetical protein